jgi:molybdopterin synthase sulfur carrier subunit
MSAEGVSGPVNAGGAYAPLIRVALPQHLRTLAGVGAEVALQVVAPITIRKVLDTLEDRYPMLRGTIRDYGSGQRRAFLRFFVCEEDWSHESLDAELPESIAGGGEALLIIGAIAGGVGDLSGEEGWDWEVDR